MTRKTKTPFRIFGGSGYWYAYSVHCRCLTPAPHVRQIIVSGPIGYVTIDGMEGRTPLEALERLKRHLGESA